MDIVCAENLHDAFFKASVSWESKIWRDEHWAVLEHILQILSTFFRLGSCSRAISHAAQLTTVIIRAIVHNLETFGFGKPPSFTIGPFRSTALSQQNMTLCRNWGDMVAFKLACCSNWNLAKREGVRGSGGYDDDDDDIESALSDSDSVGYCMLINSRSAALRESKHRCRNLS